MSRYCDQCGAQLNDADAFCQQCGHAAAPVPPAEDAYTPPAEDAYTPPPADVYAPPAAGYGPPPQTYYTPAKPKSKTGLVIGLCAAVLLVAAALVVFLVPGILPAGKTADEALKPLSSDLKVASDKVSIQCTYDSPDVIVPALYRTLDSIVYLKCWSDFGTTDVLVTVEIPGFTQKYEQKIPVTRAETQLKIHPR